MTTCALCHRLVSPDWAETDEWRESHYCATCLWGPLPSDQS